MSSLLLPSAMLSIINASQHPQDALNRLTTQGFIYPPQHHFSPDGEGWICQSTLHIRSADEPSTTILALQKGARNKQLAKAASAEELVAQLVLHATQPASDASSEGDRRRSSSPSYPSSASTSTAPTTDEYTDASETPPVHQVPTDSGDILTKRQAARMAAAHAQCAVLDTVLERWLELGEVQTVLVAIDVEREEVTPHRILEVGVAMDIPGYGCKGYHAVIEEALGVRNEHCPNDRWAYALQDSVLVKQSELVPWLQSLLSLVSQARNGCLIGHSIDGDRKWLEGIGVDFGNLTICDIADVERSVVGSLDRTSLAKMASKYGVNPIGVAHNAGNDAWTTLAVCGAMSQARNSGRCKLV